MPRQSGSRHAFNGTVADPVRIRF